MPDGRRRARSAPAARQTSQDRTARAGRAAIAVQVADSAWRKTLPGAAALARKAALAALAASGDAPAGELTVRLASDADVRPLNARYRDKDKPTNVLSFPGRAPSLGDVVLARETVEREAAEQGKTMDAHLAHLVVHGVLHCMGYDHMIARDARRMEAAEVAVLARLGYGDPYRMERAAHV